MAVAALDVGDADCELGQALPQRSLVVRAVLPRGLKHLVRVERRALVQQILGVGEGFVRGQLEIVWDAGHAPAARRKESAQGVAGPSVARPAGFVAIASGHLPIRPLAIPGSDHARQFGISPSPSAVSRGRTSTIASSIGSMRTAKSRPLLAFRDRQLIHLRPASYQEKE